MYAVYILYSPAFRKTYVGYTTDLERRLEEHNVTADKGWTISYRPWELLHFEEFESKTLAIKRERYLKTGIGRDFIKLLIKKKYVRRCPN